MALRLLPPFPAHSALKGIFRKAQARSTELCRVRALVRLWRGIVGPENAPQAESHQRALVSSPSVFTVIGACLTPCRHAAFYHSPRDVIEQTRASSLPNAGMEALSRDALGPSSSQRTSVASIGHGSSAHGDGDGIDEGCGVSSSGGASVSQRQRAASIGSRRSSSPGARRRSRENNGTALFPPRGQVSQQRALVEGTVVEATPEEESGGPQQERELQPGSAKLAGFFMGASNRHPLALRLINEPVVLAESVSAMPALGGHARGLAAFELAQQALRASGRGLSLDGREKMLPLSHIQHSSGLHISDLSPVSRGNPRGHRFSLECLHVESAARKDVSDGTANKASRSNSLEGQRAPQPGKRWSAEPSALGTVSTSGQSGRELPSAIHVLLAEDNKVPRHRFGRLRSLRARLHAPSFSVGGDRIQQAISDPASPRSLCVRIDQVNQLVAKAVLGRCGATCVVANDGAQRKPALLAAEGVLSSLQKRFCSSACFTRNYPV